MLPQTVFAKKSNLAEPVVDGDMTIEEGAEEYIQTEEDLIEDMEIVIEKLEKLDIDATVIKEELKARKENNKNGIATRAVTITKSEAELFSTVKPVNIKFGITAFKQTNDYYCGPATVKQVINFNTGTSKSQAFYAGKLGTTTAGTDMTKIAGVLNTYQSRTTYKYLSFTSQLMWRNRVAMNTPSGIPTVMDISSKATNWLYETNGHFLNTAGFDCRTSPETVWICDPHPVYHGVHKSTVNAAFTVNNAHFRKAIIW